jgi:hypothetical protein
LRPKDGSEISSEAFASFHQAARPYSPVDITLRNICTLKDETPQWKINLEEIDVSLQK